MYLLSAKTGFHQRKILFFSLNFVFMNYELSLEQNWGYVNIADTDSF